MLLIIDEVGKVFAVDYRRSNLPSIIITTTAVREEELNRAEHSDNARL
jgi:hypothetical protein